MSNIILYNTDKNQIQIQVKFDNETVWLNQPQLTELFDTDKTSVLKHIQYIYVTKELDDDATCVKFAQIRIEDKREVLHYNLDAIITQGTVTLSI